MDACMRKAINRDCAYMEWVGKHITRDQLNQLRKALDMPELPLADPVHLDPEDDPDTVFCCGGNKVAPWQRCPVCGELNRQD